AMIVQNIRNEQHTHYIRSLDGIRGIACLLVVASHISDILHSKLPGAPTSLGPAGVIIFFVLSSFLMTTLYYQQPFSKVSVEKYAIARFSRIAPAYWLAVAVAFCLYHIFPGFHYDMNPAQTVRSFAFLGTTGVFWSIPPEVQFYFFFAFIWFSNYAFANGSKLWRYVVILFFIASMLTMNHWLGLLLPSKLHIFGAGIVGALIIRKTQIRDVLKSPIAQVMLVLASLVYWNVIAVHEDEYTDVVLALLFGCTVASLSFSTPVTRVLESSVMKVLGAASFSIYLFHDLTLRVIERADFFAALSTGVQLALLCVTAVAIPVAFHFAVEAPLTRWTRDALSRRILKPQSVSVLS
ncbi:MAG TPA: acyltransferase, partial [Ensifer sp.]|nr:acyltransferase [Ensifer sp.]